MCRGRDHGRFSDPLAPKLVLPENQEPSLPENIQGRAKSQVRGAEGRVRGAEGRVRGAEGKIRGAESGRVRKS